MATSSWGSLWRHRDLADGSRKRVLTAARDLPREKAAPPAHRDVVKYRRAQSPGQPPTSIRPARVGPSHLKERCNRCGSAISGPNVPTVVARHLLLGHSLTVRANPRISSSLQQVTEHPYDINASDFVRFRVEANDDIVGGVVRSVTSESNADREQFRQGLSDDASTMQLFAMRRTLQARRQSSMSLVYEALDGFALLGFDDVPWDTWLKASLFVARLVGGDLELIRRRFAEVAHADAAARFDVALEPMNRVSDLSQCSLVEVKTTYGVGFVETFIFRDGSTVALGGAPRQGDNRVAY